MAIQLGSAYGKIVIDSSGVTVGVGNATKSLGSLSVVAEKVGGAMQNAGRAMTIGLTLPILAIGGASIKAASDLEETRNKIKVVFGDMSNDVLDWGNKSALAFGQSKQQALEAAGTFGNLFTSMGLANGKSADMSKGLVELAADLASFNNIDPALVLEKLRSGLVGEVEPLRTLGINLTMAATKAKAVQMGLAGANGEVSQAALLQARYALILEQSSNAQGDFARTADGMANQSRIMSAQLKDSAAMLGQNLLPIALKVVQGLNKMLETFNNAPPFVQKGILVFMGFLAVLGPLLSVLGSVISFLSGVSTIAGSLGISLSAVAAGAGSAITALIGIGGAALSLLGSILLLAAGPVLLYLAFKNNFMGITDTVKQLWFIIKFYFSQIAKWIVDSFRKINLIEIGRNMLQGFANGIMSAIPLIVAAAKNAGTAAMTAIKGILGIHSPSAEFMKLGAFSGQGFQMGLAGAMDPNLIARTMAKPVQQMNSQSNSNVIHLSNGLTLRDVDALMNEKINRFATRALGGV
jgi:phage-related minor tail protein